MSFLGLAPFPALAAAEFEVVILKDGQRITGEIVADKPNALYVDLGYDILRIPRDQILRRAKVAEAAAGAKPLARGRDPGIGDSLRERPRRIHAASYRRCRNCRAQSLFRSRAHQASTAGRLETE